MTKKEIVQKLRERHVEIFDYARSCAEKEIKEGATDEKAFATIEHLAIRANAIIEAAEVLGVELNRALIDDPFMVTLWRNSQVAIVFQKEEQV